MHLCRHNTVMYKYFRFAFLVSIKLVNLGKACDLYIKSKFTKQSPSLMPPTNANFHPSIYTPIRSYKQPYKFNELRNIHQVITIRMMNYKTKSEVMLETGQVRFASTYIDAQSVYLCQAQRVDALFTIFKSLIWTVCSIGIQLCRLLVEPM